MFNNSFNRLSNCNENCSSSENKLKNNESLDDNDDNDDWESKYDVSLSISREEYLQSLQRIRNVDEKANKYFLVISILMAALFLILSSSSIENLEFNHLQSIISFLFTLLLILSFLASLFFGTFIFKDLLNCFKLVNSRRMPDLVELLDSTGQDNSVQYKHALITYYQDAINLMDRTITEKQAYIKKVSAKIGMFTLSLFSSLIILIILKIMG